MDYAESRCRHNPHIWNSSIKMIFEGYTWNSSWSRYPSCHLSAPPPNRALASLSLPGGQDKMISSIFPHFFVVSLIFPQFFFFFSSSIWSSSPPGQALAMPLPPPSSLTVGVHIPLSVTHSLKLIYWQIWKKMGHQTFTFSVFDIFILVSARWWWETDPNIRGEKKKDTTVEFEVPLGLY